MDFEKGIVYGIQSALTTPEKQTLLKGLLGWVLPDLHGETTGRATFTDDLAVRIQPTW